MAQIKMPVASTSKCFRRYNYQRVQVKLSTSINYANKRPLDFDDKVTFNVFLHVYQTFTPKSPIQKINWHIRNFGKFKNFDGIPEIFSYF